MNKSEKLQLFYEIEIFIKILKASKDKQSMLHEYFGFDEEDLFLSLRTINREYEYFDDHYLITFTTQGHLSNAITELHPIDWLIEAKDKDPSILYVSSEVLDKFDYEKLVESGFYFVKEN